MLHNAILIDVFNLIYRVRKSETAVSDIAENFIDFVDISVKPYLKKDGDLWLLFDPIPKSDLGVSRYFSQATDRQEIVSTYKSNRKHDPTITGVATFLRKYYTYRGDHIKSCLSSYLEADDFVEPILAKYDLKKAHVAMLTTDLDWAKYLSNHVTIINKTFDKPYTVEDYIHKYKFTPTPASVTVNKALFGDGSDAITGAVVNKYTKSIKVKFFIFEDWVKEIAKSGEDLNPLMLRLKQYTFTELTKKEPKTVEDQAWLLLNSPEVKTNLMTLFVNNVRVIKSRCTDVDKFTHAEPENAKINTLLAATVGKAPGTKKKFKFGNRKISKS